MAQKKITHQDLGWYRVAVTYKMKPNLSWYTEAEGRTFMNTKKLNQRYVRTILKYKFKSGIEFGPGFAFFQSLPNDAFYSERKITNELRPFVELNHTTTFGKYRFSKRFWSEARYFGLNDNAANELLWRQRLRLLVDRKIYAKENFSLTLAIWNELMINTDKQITHNIFDQNRLGANAAFAFNKNIGLELSYFNFYQSTNSAGAFLNRNIYRVSLLLNFESHKKSGQ